MKKLYIIQKRVLASSLDEAKRLDKTTKPDEIYLDQDYMKNSDMYNPEKQKIGFK